MRDATKDILHTSDLLLVLLLTNYLHPSRKLLQAMRKIDAMNGCHFDDSFFDVCRTSPYSYETDGTLTESEVSSADNRSGSNKDSLDGNKEDKRTRSQYFDASEELTLSSSPNDEPRFSDHSRQNAGGNNTCSQNDTEAEMELSDEVVSCAFVINSKVTHLA